MRAREFIIESNNIASAEQVWDYVDGVHPKDQQGGGFLKSLVMRNPQYELKRVPLSSLHVPNDEDEGNDPYGRAMFVDAGHAREYSQHHIDKKPLVIDSQGHILDGAHRAWAAVELLNKTDIMAWVPVKQSVAEGATVTRIDSKPITDFVSRLKAYKHTDDWSQSGIDTGDDSYWKNKNLKTNTTKGLFAGDPRRTALYATGNAHETRYVEFTQNGQPIVYFDRKDLPAMRSRKTYLTVFDASDFRQLPTGEWFSENPSKPIKQVPIGDPFKYIADQGWIVRVTDDLDKVFKQVKNMHKVGKIAQYGAEGMNESKQSVAEGKLSVDVPNEDWLQEKIDYAKSKGRNSYGVPYMGSTTAYVQGTPPRARVMRLASLPGMKNEQMNVRKNDLKWLMDYMEKTGKLPPMGNSPDHEYLPYIMVAYNGEAWVNEGNHRIMAAYRLNWQDMPIEIRYFDGGERIKTGPMAPEKIGLA